MIALVYKRLERQAMGETPPIHRFQPLLDCRAAEPDCSADRNGKEPLRGVMATAGLNSSSVYRSSR